MRNIRREHRDQPGPSFEFLSSNSGMQEGSSTNATGGLFNNNFFKQIKILIYILKVVNKC